MKKCKTCPNWKPQQAELDYSTHYGICTCSNWKFVTTKNADVNVLDRKNLSDKYKNVQRFENQSSDIPIGSINGSRYAFVTNENFGCVHHPKN